MKRMLQIFALIAAMMVPAVAGASGLRGDMDDDGRVNINDVTTLINCLLTGNDVPAAADCDMDGNVNISDVATLINYLLSGNWPPTPPQDLEWVDLGLPSGTLWATCNVGANTPEEYGDYFAWGEIEPKEVYSWGTYKWCEGSRETLTKYCTHSIFGYNGFTDGKTNLDLEDDAAYVNWGPSWCMPTMWQQRELAEQCTWTWTTRNGVNGQLVTGPNGNSIFLPAAGYRENESLYDLGSGGNCWSRVLGQIDMASCLNFGSYGVYWYGVFIRSIGQTVRAVRAPEDNHEYVDLGLPSGTLWATCNIGASAPEEYGDYFAWGETTPKDYYDWSNYKWCNGSDRTMTKYCMDMFYGYNGLEDCIGELDPEDDAATMNWGPLWCMPTKMQQDELRDNCTWTWTTRNEVNGYLVTGPNGNSIFLPAAGYRSCESPFYEGSAGDYLSSWLDPYFSDSAYGLYCSSEIVCQGSGFRCCGSTVRAVRVP